MLEDINHGQIAVSAVGDRFIREYRPHRHPMPGLSVPGGWRHQGGTAVSSYSITITTDEATNASTTLHANVGANGRILELTVRANGPDGFTPEELPAFDLRRLISAVILAVPGSPVIEAAPVVAALPAAEYAAAPAARKAGGRPARA
ncbi:MAG: hypothetical protein J2P15_03880, partial [Micromonosporaceae bacterium]|nr:hypothetical protein [Micromonosporaceae bacterium]